MDNARAKLVGMGYAGKNLENVMNDAREAVTGTTMTMAEGVDIAAGALAAGVEQGAEMEEYHKLEGKAAGGDRKRTRLNSSHVAISYVGLCMKKKRGQIV